MPKVPALNGPSVLPSYGPGVVALQAPQSPQPAGATAEKLGEGLTAAGEAMAVIQQRADLAATKELENEFMAAADSILWEPETGYLNQLGGNAVHGYDDAIARLKDQRLQISAKARTPGVRKLATDALDRRLAVAINEMNRHSARQGRVYEVTQSDTRAWANFEAAAKDYENEERFAAAMLVASNEAETQGAINGWDEETVTRKMQEYINRGQAARYEAWAVSDPVSALEHLSSALEQIDPTIRQDLTSAVFRNAGPQLADELLGMGVVVLAKGRSADSPTGHSVVDRLPRPLRQKVIDMAESRGRSERAELASHLTAAVRDAEAAFDRGLIPADLPRPSDFTRVYGTEEGKRRHEAFKDHQRRGELIGEFQLMPPEDIQQILENRAPRPGSGFAERAKGHDALVRAAGAVLKARAEDPIHFAGTLEGNPYGLTRLPAETGHVATALASRVSTAIRLADDFGTPLRMLSNGEAERVAFGFKTATVQEKSRLLQEMRTNLPRDAFRSVMQQIAPNEPTIAAAGIYALKNAKTVDGANVSALILQGHAALNPPPDLGRSQSLVKMPEERLLRDYWVSETGDAFRSRPESNQVFMQSARAIYAARSAQEGDYSGVIDTRRWKDAIEAATGGLIAHNGHKVVPPYGMPKRDFQQSLRLGFEVLNRAGATDIAPEDLMRLPLQNAGDGRYFVMRGAGYVYDSQGRPLIVAVGEPDV